MTDLAFPEMTVGTLDHEKVLRPIELFGRVVAPAGRAESARRQAERAVLDDRLADRAPPRMRHRMQLSVG